MAISQRTLKLNGAASAPNRSPFTAYRGFRNKRRKVPCVVNTRHDTPFCLTPRHHQIIIHLAPPTKKKQRRPRPPRSESSRRRAERKIGSFALSTVAALWLRRPSGFKASETETGEFSKPTSIFRDGSGLSERRLRRGGGGKSIGDTSRPGRARASPARHFRSVTCRWFP